MAGPPHVLPEQARHVIRFYTPAFCTFSSSNSLKSVLLAFCLLLHLVFSEWVLALSWGSPLQEKPCHWIWFTKERTLAL